MRTKFKYLNGQPQTIRLNSNQKMLLQDFVVEAERDGKKTIWTAPRGLITDGASIPEFLQIIIGDPFEGVTQPAAIIHDHYCNTKERSQKDTHRIFKDLVYFEMKLNTDYGWIRWPWNLHNTKAWQYQRCKLMWAGVRGYNKVRHPKWK